MANPADEPFARLTDAALGAGARGPRRAGELMTTKVVTVQESQTLEDALRILDAGRFHHLPVLNGRRAVGVLSDRDVFRLVIGEKPLDTPVRDIMSTPPRCIESDTSVSEAAKLLLQFGFRCLMVVDDERRKTLLGIVTTMDLLRALI